MSREEDVTDERPVGRGRGRPQRGKPRSDVGRRRARRERGGRLPQQRRSLLRHDRGTPAGGGRRASRGPGPGAGRGGGAHWAGRLPPLPAVRVVREPHTRRHRPAGGDGWAAPRRGYREASPRTAPSQPKGM